ncbi:class I SAM-dependent methyltransferase [Malikia granosa]|uniref:SAM-dependent methyltransferase n=1 Tax=Malikia granosa TaxID=263067 RepID=A0A2S9K6B3_9BURK|nr:SAM-dependent methyltransferase [Malikia granosa]PRD66003.1 SAM-dependent methyltransferase [Malikia granosa]
MSASIKPNQKRQPSRAERAPEKSIQEQLPELRPGQSIELLKELHILTREGKLNQDTRRKLKQVNHLLQFIEPLLQEALAARGDVSLVDHGAGKSYLGFMLYDLFFAQREVGWVYGVETRAELVERSRALAERLGFDRMRFVATTVQEAMTSEQIPAQVDVVTALHACDTATDDAIAFGLARQARCMVLVPCCQAEVASVLRKHKALTLSRTPLSEIWRHPLHTREFGSQITNVLRCLELEAHGYQVTVTELVGWEHSMKNELILARKVGKGKASARERLQQVLDELGLQELQQRFGT